MLLTETAYELRATGKRPIAIAVIDPARAVEILISRGLTCQIAQMIASGVLANRESATALAKYRGLVQ